nr:hypothetical protein [Chloroflexia bacterium]
RAIAEATLPIWRASGVIVLDAGLAATGTRLQIVPVLAAAGLPRPPALIACTEETALVAVERLGYPATLLPLTPGSATVPLYDRETAEAVIEHRIVLGDAHEAISLIQAGLPVGEHLSLVHVVAGVAVAVDERPGEVRADELALAERAARALGASVVAVEIARTASGPVVWDVRPIAEFRHARALSGDDVAGAIAQLATSRLAGIAGDAVQTSLSGFDAAESLSWEVGDGDRSIVLSA